MLVFTPTARGGLPTHSKLTSTCSSYIGLYHAIFDSWFELRNGNGITQHLALIMWITGPHTTHCDTHRYECHTKQSITVDECVTDKHEAETVLEVLQMYLISFQGQSADRLSWLLNNLTTGTRQCCHCCVTQNEMTHVLYRSCVDRQALRDTVFSIE